MKGSLRTRLILGNGLFFLVSLVLFGLSLIWLSAQSADRLLDRELMRRTDEVARRRGPGPGGMGGPGPGMGGGPAPGQIVRPDNRVPRVFSLRGEPLGPGQNLSPFDFRALEQAMKGHTTFSNVRGGNGETLRVISRQIRREDGAIEVVQVAQESDALVLARQAQLYSLLIALPFVALASWWLGSVLSRLVLGPVGRLTEAAERIAADPTSKEQIEVMGEDEMARLGSAFNSMIEGLQEANERLETSLEQQRRFTSDAAHELRTPLSAISLAAENGLHDQATPAEVKRSLEIVQRASTSMGKLTSMLLSLARLDSRQGALQTELLDPRPVIEEAVRDAGLTEDPRLRVVGPTDPALCRVNADALRQCLRNLLENAVAYTPVDGRITVSHSGCAITIADSGEGIAAEHLDKLFDRFYRVDPSRNRASGGHGLGLSIVKALTEAQGGTIRVESEPGRGTVFILDFA